MLGWGVRILPDQWRERPSRSSRTNSCAQVRGLQSLISRLSAWRRSPVIERDAALYNCDFFGIDRQISNRPV